MNRKIKFRGQRTDTKEWVYGFYKEFEEQHYIIVTTFEETEPNFRENVETEIEVIPETVGQFFGKKDKNSKEIYPGDYLEFQNEEAENGRYEVLWEEQFELLDDEWEEEENQYTNVEIIGNKWDNPKLLK